MQAALAPFVQNIPVPKFNRTFCSQCGSEFGPGDHGFSHCADHQKKVADQWNAAYASRDAAALAHQIKYQGRDAP
jgi:hypothetical protein